MENGKIDGTNKVILQSLLLALSEAQEEVLRIRKALGETIEKNGKELLGEHEGEGQFVLKPQPDGSFIISWDLKPPDAPPDVPIVEGNNKITRHRRRAK